MVWYVRALFKTYKGSGLFQRRPLARVFLVFLYTLPSLIRGREGTGCACFFFFGRYIVACLTQSLHWFVRGDLFHLIILCCAMLSAF